MKLLSSVGSASTSTCSPDLLLSSASAGVNSISSGGSSVGAQRSGSIGSAVSNSAISNRSSSSSTRLQAHNYNAVLATTTSANNSALSSTALRTIGSGLHKEFATGTPLSGMAVKIEQQNLHQTPASSSRTPDAPLDTRSSKRSKIASANTAATTTYVGSYAAVASTPSSSIPTEAVGRQLRSRKTPQADTEATTSHPSASQGDLTGSSNGSSKSAPTKKRQVKFAPIPIVYPFFGAKLPETSKLIALKCLDYLQGKDIYAMSQVNTLWSRAAMDDALWE